MIAAFRFKLGFRVVRLPPKCGNCGSSLRFENAHFCPNCGESLPAGEIIRAAAIGHEGTVTMPKEGRDNALVGACMICKKELRVRDPATWCPFCGGPAHRAHLLEYLRKHGQCPLCGAQLDRKELKRQLS